MKKTFEPKKFILRLLTVAAALLLFAALLVVVFDPFYHYHKPLPFLKAVLWEKEYQVPGSLDHFDYNALIVGSSVAENNNNHWFDDNFDCTSIKAIRSGGAIGDLCYFINRSFESHKLDYVFLNWDPSSMVGDSEMTFEMLGAPLYLYDKNPLNDVKYLWNKDVIFERIPYILANSFIREYDEGTSYNWAASKTFSEEAVLSYYYEPATIKEMLPSNEFEEEALKNLSLVTSIIEKHPETEFYIFVPPYSILWWDMEYRNGETQSYLYAEELLLSKILEYENTKVFNFQTDTDVIYDLDNYMDFIHFSPEINKKMADSMKNGDFEIHNKKELHDSIELVLSYAMNAGTYVPETYGDRLNILASPEGIEPPTDP